MKMQIPEDAEYIFQSNVWNYNAKIAQVTGNVIFSSNWLVPKVNFLNSLIWKAITYDLEKTNAYVIPIYIFSHLWTEIYL